MKLLLILIFVIVLAVPVFGQDYPPPQYVERSDRSFINLVEFVALFGEDFWAVIKSPTDLDRRGWATVGLMAAVWGSLYYWDEEIQSWVIRNRDDGLLKIIDEQGEKVEKLGMMGETNRYYAAGIVVGYAFKWEKLERVSTDILFSHFVGGLIRQAFLQAVGRARPNQDEGAYSFSSGNTSMPSGHSSTIFQLATVLSHHFPMWWAQTVFYGGATLVSLQRVTSSQHWASDAFLGACFGYGVARVVVGTNDRRGYLVTPVYRPSTGGGMAIQFSF